MTDDTPRPESIDRPLRRRTVLRAASLGATGIGLGVAGGSTLLSGTAGAREGAYERRVRLGPFEARTLDVADLSESDPPTDPDLQDGQQGSAEEEEIPRQTPAVEGDVGGRGSGEVLAGTADVLTVRTQFDGLTGLDVVRVVDFDDDGDTTDEEPFFVVPGDPVVAAGEDHLVTCVNDEVAFVRKDAAPDGGTRVPDDPTAGDPEYLSVYRAEDWFENVLSADLGVAEPALFENLILSDPRVRYDDAAGRFLIAWFITSLIDGRGAYLLSASATADPCGEWYNYLIEPADNVGLVDYPSLGYDADGIYLTQNFFSFPNFEFEGATFDVVDRAAALAGEDLRVYEFTTLTDPGGGLAFTVQPADAPGESAPYAVSSRFFQGQALTVWEVTERGDGTPDLTNDAVRVSPYTNPVEGSPQLGSEDRIDMGDDRVLDATYDPTAGTVWAAHTVDDGSVRWYELDPQGPALAQSQTFRRRGLRTFFPAVGTNGDSTLLAYNSCGGGAFASVEVAGRRRGAPAGDLEDFEVIQEGEQTYDYINDGEGDQTSQVFRWGDYNAVSVDPVDDSYWVVAQYANRLPGRPTETEVYGTRIANVAVDGE